MAITERVGTVCSPGGLLAFTPSSIESLGRSPTALQPGVEGGPRTATAGSRPFAALAIGSLQNCFVREPGRATMTADAGGLMSKRQLIGATAILAISMTGLVALSIAVSAQNAAKPPASESKPRQVMPRYNGDGALQLPGDYRQWVFVGSSLGLSYTDGGPSSMNMEMFHETLMEPTAYKHFVDTGTFREGTMLALLLHGTGEKVMPARRGKFAAEVHGVEMAVKDTSHRAEGWAYYNFGGMNGIRPAAQAMPKDSCYSCHVQHAKRDNVFLQFYGLLAEAANVKVGAAAHEPAAPATLAIGGLDPVMLAIGREEMGKPEIVETHGSLRYQFVSEPNRARFAAEPDTFAARSGAAFTRRVQ
jgi:hypothetical protein